VKLDTLASAVLVWLPKGVTPAVDALETAKVGPPPNPNPEPWWCLEDAVIRASEVQRDHDKAPWIKVGQELLDPSEIAQAYRAIRTMRAFDPPRS